MGEAARRRQMGYDGRRFGEAVVAALNADAGGDVWESGREATPEHFLVLGLDDAPPRAGLIQNKVAAETPHRVVSQLLFRRGEPWLMAMIFDPSQEYRTELYDRLAANAVRIVHANGAERIDEVRHVIVHSTWPEQQGNVSRSLRPEALEAGG
jgi:hypothetical protein